MAQQATTDGRRLLQSHIEDQGVAFAQQLAPAHKGETLLAGACLQMAGDEGHRAGHAAMGEGNITTGGTANGRRDAGHHSKGDLLLAQAERLFTAAAKDVRVAALEADHLFALLGQINQQLIDLLLA